jgi:hypothetical protein
VGNLILILGMGRSGTSAMAQILGLCGAHLPDNLLGPASSNVKGHFEPVDALDINEEFLNSFGLTWFDPTFRLQHEPPPHAAFTERIVQFLTHYASKSPLVVKEPRITALTRYWFDAAATAGWDVKVVIPVRHPHDVRASLAARDGLSADLSDALWIKYNLLAEHATRDRPRVFVAYDQLLTDWRGQLKRAARALDLDLEYGNDEAVEAFLDSTLRHHVTAHDVTPDNPWTAAIFQQLTRFCADDAVETNEMTRLYELYVRAERMLRNAHLVPWCSVSCAKAVSRRCRIHTNRVESPESRSS